MANLTNEFLDMTYPDKYYKNVIEPAKTGKGPVPSKVQMLSKSQPFKAMRIGLDPYLPKSMQAGYGAFRAAPTTAARTAIGSNIAYGLPFAYAGMAGLLQDRLEDQGLTGEGGIYDISGGWGAMGAGADIPIIQKMLADRRATRQGLNQVGMQRQIRAAERQRAAQATHQARQRSTPGYGSDPGGRQSTVSGRTTTSGWSGRTGSKEMMARGGILGAF